ncbi:MAG TPA: metallophosphatase domain-containing protein [Flavisolibacter sp.]|nr:metallophosphatase domain-containing protein [Flavisolibacter sp.]
MRFVVISDTHCRHQNLRLPKGDVLLHAGDVSYKGKKAEVLDFLNWFWAQPFMHKIFIAGNHDFFFEKEKPDEINELIPEGVIYLNDSGTQINGLQIWGSPITPWFYNWAFNRKRGEQIRRHWNLIPSNTDILMTHGPAYGYLDQVINDKHVGCLDLFKRVQQIKPKFHVFGHIHESYGDIKRNGVRFINACVLNEQYELVNKPLIFDL